MKSFACEWRLDLCWILRAACALYIFKPFRLSYARVIVER